MEKKTTPTKRGKLLNILKWIWFVAVIIGAIYYFRSNYQDISQYLESISFSRVVLSILLVLIGKFTLSDLTRISLKKIDYHISYKEALTITSITQLGKYLPGGIWHVAGKFGMYKARRIATKKTTQAIIFENLWLLSSALVLGVVFLISSSPDILCKLHAGFCQPWINMAVLGLFPVLWIIAMVIIDHVFYKEKRYTIKEVLILIVEMLLIWISFGISFWLVFPINNGFLPAITGAFSLSWVAGYAAFFAPGGIGVREYLLTLILGSYFSSGEVAIYATVHRLIWVVIEILLGAGCVLIFGIPVTKNKDESS